MKRGAGTHYPYVTDGKGKGIIEDTSPYELVEMSTKTDKDGTLPQIMDMYSGKEVSWDYRKFDLEYCNVFFKDNVYLDFAERQAEREVLMTMEDWAKHLDGILTFILRYFWFARFCTNEIEKFPMTKYNQYDKINLSLY